jgi:hypothetical protein
LGERVAHRVDEGSKGAEEGEERRKRRVEESLAPKAVGEAGISNRKEDRPGKIHPGLEEGDDLGRPAWSSHDQDVFCVAKDGVAEEDAEEHGTERQQLLHLVCRRQERGETRAQGGRSCILRLHQRRITGLVGDNVRRHGNSSHLCAVRRQQRPGAVLPGGH